MSPTSTHLLSRSLHTSKGAEAVAAQVAGIEKARFARMDEAIAIEDSIYALRNHRIRLSLLHELFGSMLMEMKRLQML